MTFPSLCIVQEWVSVGSTLGQVALGQLAAVSSHSLDNVEIRARCLSLMGKYVRLLAVQEDPIYLCALWDRHKQVDNTCVHACICVCYIEGSHGCSVLDWTLEFDRIF